MKEGPLCYCETPIRSGVWPEFYVIVLKGMMIAFEIFKRDAILC